MNYKDDIKRTFTYCYVKANNNHKIKVLGIKAKEKYSLMMKGNLENDLYKEYKFLSCKYI